MYLEKMHVLKQALLMAYDKVYPVLEAFFKHAPGWLTAICGVVCALYSSKRARQIAQINSRSDATQQCLKYSLLKPAWESF